MEQKNLKVKDTSDKTTAKGSPRRWIKHFLSRPAKERLLLTIGIALGVLVGGVIILRYFGPKPDTKVYEPDVVSNYVPPPEPIFSPLTGMETTEELAARPVTGVMIENSMEARPQSGLAEAGIVFEAIAEGGITRFLALYQEAKPGNLGPIRSARPYYVRWAGGFGARYVHSGGSGEALALIQSIGVKDMDHGHFGERVASRVSSRYAPHNVYTSMERIDTLGAELGFSSSDFTPLARKTDEPSKAESPASATRIDFNISGANYNTYYTYEPETNSYKRFMAGVSHNDQDSGKQIEPKVIIALIMGFGIHADGIHSVYNNVGSGEALIFQDGKMTTATWNKPSDTGSLELKDPEGKSVQLNAGQTWITAIQSASRVTYTP